MRKFLSTGSLLTVIIILLTLWLVPGYIERSMNQVISDESVEVTEQALELHGSLLIADAHADSLLWSRDLRRRSTFGHVDFPRLKESNVAIQVFAAVTKSPMGLNYEENTADSLDNITLLALTQTWPPGTWSSLKERALYQASKLSHYQKDADSGVTILRSQGDLQKLLALRAEGGDQLGALLATEGSHVLEGRLGNIRQLYNAGYRIMGLQHFFDNDLGGSLHGVSDGGLTEFGRAAVTLMEDMNIIVDLAHSSPAVVEDVLESASRPVIVSHTGMRGLCESPRNISDDLLKRVAQQGGLVGIGFWEEAVCDATPAGIARMVRYAVDTLGVNSVALGSDFDGAVTTPFDGAGLPALTQALLDEDLSEQEIRRVMGENLRDFLLKWLPES